jgi:hypothetical protein
MGRMASSAQLTANRANAQLSTGPRSDAGKAAASRNASSHGLASSTVVLAREDAADFDRMLETYVREFAPSSEHQHFLVRQMVEARWRLERIRRVETALLDQMLTGAFRVDTFGRIAQTMQQRGDAQAKLERYATAAERAYYRAHRELMTERKLQAREQAARVEAALEAYIMAPPPRGEEPVLQNEPNPICPTPLNATARPAEQSSLSHAPSPDIHS